MKLSAVLSDIGEVVAPFDNNKTFRAFAKFSGLPVAKVEDVFMGRGAVLVGQYERDEISTQEFQKIICSRLNIAKRDMPSEEDFYEAYAHVFTVRPEVLAEWAVLQLRDIPVVAVSNICEMRYRRLHEMGVLPCFDHEVMSFQEGMAKPSEELMVRALDRAGSKAEETIFVDDLAENLVPAAKLGIVTHHFTGVDSFLKFLASIGA